ARNQRPGHRRHQPGGMFSRSVEEEQPRPREAQGRFVAKAPLTPLVRFADFGDLSPRYGGEVEVVGLLVLLNRMAVRPTSPPYLGERSPHVACDVAAGEGGFSCPPLLHPFPQVVLALPVHGCGTCWCLELAAHARGVPVVLRARPGNHGPLATML